MFSSLSRIVEFVTTFFGKWQCIFFHSDQQLQGADADNEVNKHIVQGEGGN